MSTEPGAVPASEEPPDLEDDLEWDDTPTALALRAVFSLLAGGFLLWSQLRAPFRPGAEWNRWILSSVVADLLLPLGIVWMFFAQGVRRVPIFATPRSTPGTTAGISATGERTRAGRWPCSPSCCSLCGGPRAMRVRALLHAGYFPAVSGVSGWLWLIASLAVYMFCWEWFFRGFLLFGIAQGFLRRDFGAASGRWLPLSFKPFCSGWRMAANRSRNITPRSPAAWCWASSRGGKSPSPSPSTHTPCCTSCGRCLS